MRTIRMGTYGLPSTCKPRDTHIRMIWEWIVLKECDGKALLLSRDIIDWEMYHGENTFFERAKPTTWEKCNLRELMKDYYEKGFTAGEKVRILTNELGDHLFLLTAEEADRYLRTKECRIAEMIMADGSKVFRERPYWWLNTTGAEECMQQVMTPEGEIDDEGIDNDADEVGVRPAMWVKWW